MPSKHAIAASEPPSQSVLLSRVEYSQQTELSPVTQVDLQPRIFTPRLPQHASLHQTDHLQRQTKVRELQKSPSQQPNLPRQTHSSLMVLPLEMKWHIFSYLKGPEPTLIILRRTHPQFRYIIPKCNHRKELLYAHERAHLLAADQLAADDKQPKLFLPHHLACFTCLEVLPSERFSDRNTYKARRVGGKDAHKRFCLNCGLKDWKYTLGQVFYINRVEHMVVRPSWTRDHETVACVGDLAIRDLVFWPEHQVIDRGVS